MLKLVAGLLSREKTVIWIAHKLETVLDADEVVVLDGGVIVEQGAPAALLRDSQGILHRLMRTSSGPGGAGWRRDAVGGGPDAAGGGAAPSPLALVGGAGVYGDYLSLARQYQQSQLVRSLSAPPPGLGRGDGGASPPGTEPALGGDAADRILRRAYSEPPADAVTVRPEEVDA